MDVLNYLVELLILHPGNTTAVLKLLGEKANLINTSTLLVFIYHYNIVCTKRLHSSGGQYSCKFIGTKGSVYIR